MKDEDEPKAQLGFQQKTERQSEGPTPRPSRHQAALVWMDKTLLLHRVKSTITGSGLHRWTRQITQGERQRQIKKLQGSRRDEEASRRHQAEDRRATTTEDPDHRSNETDAAPKTNAPPSAEDVISQRAQNHIQKTKRFLAAQ